MPRVFVARQIPDVGLKKIQAVCETIVWPELLPPSRQALIEKVRGCDGVLTLLSDRVDGEVMDAAGPQLKVISNFAVGYNNIDVAAAHTRNIAVGNTPGVLTEATADIALGLMLAASRRFQESIDYVRNLKWQTWEPRGLLGHDMTGKTLGIVGMGRIGASVAKRCHGGWGMKTIYTARSDKPEMDRRFSARRVSFEQLLAESDFVSIHTDLNSKTQHLFNATAFKQMKPTAVLVNTARGGIVDQIAMYNALKAGQIFAAGLDVTDPEPLPDDSPLRELSNCILLPHIGSATISTRDQMANIAADNLLAGIVGEPLPHAVKIAVNS